MLVMAALAAGWMQRTRLMQWLETPSSTVSSAQAPDVVYHWVDQQGASHFSQEPGEGRKAVVYDGSKITAVEPVRAPLGGSSGQEAPKKQAGHEILNVRNELEQNARSMSEKRDAQQGL